MLAASPAAGQAVVWTLEPGADYVLGASLTDTNDQFGRVLSVALTPDGGLVVLDASPVSLRTFRPDGSRRATFGGEGDGPEEFRGPLQVVVVGQTVVVVDQRGKRLRFDLDGRLQGTHRFEIADSCDDRSNVRVAGLLGDGAVLVRCEERMFGRVRGEYRQEVGLIRLPEAPGLQRIIGWFPADSGRTDGGTVPIPRPYAPRVRLLHASAGGHLFVASSDRSRVEAFGFDGNLVGSLQVPLSPRMTTERDFAEHIEESTRVGGSDNDQRVVREWAEEMPRATQTPVIRRLIAGGEDELWVQGWMNDGTWVVVGVASERVRAHVAIPPGTEVVAANEDRVVLLTRDRFGVETLLVHRIRRGPSEAGA